MKETELQQAYDRAAANAQRIKAMHDKLVADIGELESRRAMIKGKQSVLRTREGLNELDSRAAGAGSAFLSLDQMEEKVDQALLEADALAELRRGPNGDLDERAVPSDRSANVDDELAALKQQLKNKP